MKTDTKYSEKLKNYFSAIPEILCVYLFGSTAKDKDSIHSDVDIAILYDGSVAPTEYTDRRVALSVELNPLLGKNVDIVILNRASPYLKFQALREGIAVYESPTRKNRSFEARSIIEYFDFLPIKRFLEASLMKEVREG